MSCTHAKITAVTACPGGEKLCLGGEIRGNIAHIHDLEHAMGASFDFLTPYLPVKKVVAIGI